jgi:hypothetical protein
MHAYLYVTLTQQDSILAQLLQSPRPKRKDANRRGAGAERGEQESQGLIQGSRAKLS